MEMKQEFHSVDMKGSASEAIELSSSLNSSPASPQRSNYSSIPPNHSPPADPAQAAQQSTGTPVSEASALSRTGPYSRKQALKSLEESIPHSMRWDQLHKEEKAHHKDAIRHKRQVRRLSKELYLIVSLYALLQGSLFAAVAQSTVFTCADWWGPVGIMIIVTLGAMSGSLYKLHRMGWCKEEAKKFERRQSAVYDKIAQLFAKGSACCLDALEPEHTEVFDPEPGMVCIFSLYGLLVLGFLAGFSVLITVCCYVMICQPCRCQP